MSEIAKVTLEKFKDTVKHEELYHATMLLLEDIQKDYQVIMEYCGFNEDGEEVISVGIIGLPFVFDYYTIACKDGKVTINKDLK